MQREGLASRLQSAGLAQHATAILELARDSVRIDLVACNQDQFAPGASRFGGLPDLPDGFSWPTYAGKPLGFLAQISADDLPRGNPLPSHGSLVFFYETESMKWGFDPIDRGCARVVRIDAAPAALTPTSAPSPAERFAPHALSFTSTVDLPDSFDLVFEPIYRRMTEEQLCSYEDLVASLAPSTHHHVLGHPQLIQGDMRLECELAAMGIDAGRGIDPDQRERHNARALDWELLLQLDTDEARPGWCWGDVGRIYFWIRRADLAAGRFDESWLVLQCY